MSTPFTGPRLCAAIAGHPAYSDTTLETAADSCRLANSRARAGDSAAAW
ncbi:MULTISPECIES: hypothetical protein [unclassified Streptomyces]|uniref:Uncharacterized protein n=1 Tax=Streptomyces sp. NBC_00119 TaxID=2975659 RepID=A0AAU1U0N9_9ACTN|nr:MULTISPECIES: hypothetical protein [unclassified Streptomyces]MCX4648463.1 hypothetical protein [Streptomyces sp. NBC_01446]MCX5323417.1 hypothetical protein [Streptomyces sp. NBC_00120]